MPALRQCIDKIVIMNQFLNKLVCHLFRGGSESAMLKGLTALDVLKYEQEELGNKDVVSQPGIDCRGIYPAS